MNGRGARGGQAGIPLPREAFSQVGRGARIAGRLSGCGLLLVHGQVTGGVELEGDLLVAKGGNLEAAPAVAARLLVQGTARGEMFIRGPAELGEGGRLEGTLHADRFEAARAGHLDARLVIGDRGKAAPEDGGPISKS